MDGWEVMKLARLDDGPEIFHTIQGEGISAGQPAVFVRVSRCNLHCVWCDTEHTWNFEGTPWKHQKDRDGQSAKYRKDDVTYEISPQGIAHAVIEYRCNRVVLTGGEPLLQQDGLLDVIHLVRDTLPSCQFEVETNGTRIPSKPFYESVDQFNVSPKLGNSGMAAKLRLSSTALEFFADSDKAWFKFVVKCQDDLEEIMQIVADCSISLDRLLLMPEGRTAAEMDRIAPRLADSCRNLGVRYCDRLHVRIWGDQRGV